jgi:branched-chain amino acid transport system substrate-binding protein
MLLAARLAVEEINASGGIGGRPVELLAHDDHGDPDSALAVAGALVRSDAVAVVGHVFSSTTLAAAPIYAGGATPLPVITPSSSAPEVATAGDHLFRICPTDNEHAAALATWVRNQLGLVRGEVLYLNDPYGRGIRQAFASGFQALGGQVLHAVPYLGDTPDVAAYLDRVAAERRAEFLVVAGNRSEAEEVLRQARLRNLRLPLLGGDGLEGIEAAGELAEGVYVTTAYHPSVPSPANTRFVGAFRKRFPGGGDPNQPAAATYDAIHLLRDVILAGGATRRAVQATLAQVGRELPPFVGVTGVIAFDEQGDLTQTPILIGTVRNGALEIAERR